MKKSLLYLTLLSLFFGSTLMAMERQHSSRKRSLDNSETSEQPQERRQLFNYLQAAPSIPTAYYDIGCLARKSLNKYKDEKEALEFQDEFTLQLSPYVPSNFPECLNLPMLNEQQRGEIVFLLRDGGFSCAP